MMNLKKHVKHRNLIFSNGIDFVHEFFNVERKVKNNILSKSIQLFGNNHLIKKVFTKIADKGILSLSYCNVVLLKLS